MVFTAPPSGCTSREYVGSGVGDGWDCLPLDPAHAKTLETSGISPSVAKARGYRTLTTKAAITKRGFGDAQAIPPGLLIPQYTPAGELSGYQFRPDQPRQHDGRIVKYETPSRTRPGLDANPLTVKWIQNPDVPLWVTEGSKKADAAASHELPCVSVPGVTAWHTNEATASWNLLPLKARTIYLAFDSDATRKRAVRTQLVKLAAMLRQRGAEVRFVMLPDLPSGAKQGLDDWFGAAGMALDLQRLATSDDPPEIASGDDPELNSGFAVREGRICWAKPAPGGGAALVPLAEFSASIVEERTIETGAERRREYAIAGALADGSPLPTATVSAREFGAMAWVSREWGARAIVVAGMGATDRLREAVQRLSPDPMTRTIYEQPGWWELPGHGRCFLHAGGAIGAEGAVEGVEVQLPNAAAHVHLPHPPDGAELLASVRAVINLIDIAPDRVSVPCFAAAMRAPLCAALPADFTVWLFGPSGALKSELAALIMRCFGHRFDRTRLPAQWSGTANALERLAFTFNDLPFVIDDFAPTGGPRDVDRLHATAERVIRGAGNVGGRERMNADGTLRPVFRSEGLIIATGEDLPRGHSLRARLVSIEVAKGDVYCERLTVCQHEPLRSLPAQAMAGYLRWLAPQLDGLADSLPDRLAELRGGLVTPGAHLRTPDALANLALGWRFFLDFAASCGAVSDADAVIYWNRVLAALRQLDHAQSEHQRTEEPAAAYLAALRAAIAAGKAHVSGPNGDAPTNPHAWGWRERVVDGAMGESREWQPGGSHVGWVADGDLFLEPGAAHQAIGSFDPKAVSLTLSSLAKRLHEGGYLAATDQKRETLKIRRTLSGQRREVLHLRADALYADISDQPNQFEQNSPKSTTRDRSGAGREPDHATAASAPNGRVSPFIDRRWSGAATDSDRAGERETPGHFSERGPNGRIGRVLDPEVAYEAWEDTAV